jgi:hypothetical protein
VKDPIHREAKSAEEATQRRYAKVLKCAERGAELFMVGSGSIPKRKKRGVGRSRGSLTTKMRAVLVPEL